MAAAWLSYDRPTLEAPGRSLEGERELEYFIGSGHRGRTYLFEKQGFWFESPVNWYGKQRVWDMNPKSLDVQEMPLTLKIDSSCLHCHASAVQPVLPDASNHFAAQPFLHGGITCESCHGSSSAHLASAGTMPILNPAKLSPSRRDSICLQCHLEGEIAVNRPGRSLAEFVPGGDLADYVTRFVHALEPGANRRATSQWEALLQSECKQESGDRLTCITCHDPHTSPAPAQRIAYYRERCLTCHREPSFVSAHHPHEPDCTSCHMPREQTRDVAHEQLTDHRIQRPFVVWPVTAQTDDLMAIGGAAVSDRDLGLAYFQFAQHRDQKAGQRALSLLKRAERSNQEQPDADLHTALGFLEQLSGDTQDSRSEYRAALRADPASSVAAGNLAILEAREGNTKNAAALLRLVSENDPAETAAGVDLAMIECSAGDPQAAVKTLGHLLEFSPDHAKAKQILAAIENKSMPCGP
jgi:predicted CXXCH cytochrome family protein